MLRPEQLLTDVEAHLRATGMRPTNFGKEALGDPGFVFDLRNGRSPSLKVAARVYEFMAASKPRRRVA
jgi:hypothetical protein